MLTVGGEKLNEATDAPQNLESDIGKILFIDFKDKEKIIFLGHRNPQGLFVDNKVIIATEHGPRGGDEINKIEFKKLWMANKPHTVMLIKWKKTKENI